MPYPVLANTAASISELKRDPMGTVAAGEGGAVLILNRNQPAFYCVPAALYERMLDTLEDVELHDLCEERAGEESIPVSLDEL